MPVPVTENLIALLIFNHDVIHEQLKDISHEESLLQLPYRGNCLNWVVGHLVTAREDSLTLLGLPGVLTEAEKIIYGYGSEPLVDAAKASDLDDLLKKLDESFNLLTGSLEKLTQSDAD